MDIIELAMLKGAELGIEAYFTIGMGVPPNRVSAIMQTSDEHKLSQELLDKVLEYAVRTKTTENNRKAQ